MNKHRWLCEIGAKFLKRPESANGHGCHFAIIEPSCYGENPDVFGIRHGANGFSVGTVLIEAKTSRSDFLADRKKPHRMQPETGIGKWRYYICPTDLIKPKDLPEKWGLIYVNERGHCNIVAGAMAVPKDKYISEYGMSKGKPQYFRNNTKVIESFAAHTFHERHIQNELNLLVMALARLDDPEAILYMQREFNGKLAKLQNLQLEHEKLQRSHDSKERKIKWYRESDMNLIRTNLMTREGYSPYCGKEDCFIGMPRTEFKDGQFRCRCGWVSQFDTKFIAEYKQKWRLK